MKQRQNQKSPNKSRNLLTVEFPDTVMPWIIATAEERGDSMGSVVREAVREKIAKGSPILTSLSEGASSKSTEEVADNSLIETPQESHNGSEL